MWNLCYCAIVKGSANVRLLKILDFRVPEGKL